MSVIKFIQVRCPEYAELPNIQDFISIAEAMTGHFSDKMIGDFGTKREYAVALRTMHIIALDQMGQSQNYKSGFVTSETTGQLSRSYNVPEDLKRDFPDLVTTQWGVELAGLIKCEFFLPMTSAMLKG